MSRTWWPPYRAEAVLSQLADRIGPSGFSLVDTVTAVSGEPLVRVGLRVEDVGAASALYESFGFAPVGTVPGRDGQVVMAVLRRGPLQLLVDALVGMPFPDSVRERQTKMGPRGLGVVIGIEVDDVDEAARRCQAAGCVVTGLRGDALARLGYDDTALTALNPALITASHNAYGWDGPWRDIRSARSF